MAIVELLKTYGLNRDLIESDRWMSERLAQAHENTSRELLKDADDQRFVHLMASATEYRRAGAHSLLLSDRKSANKMFQAAAKSYIRLNNPYALMMLSCADANPDSVRAFVFVRDNFPGGREPRTCDLRQSKRSHYRRSKYPDRRARNSSGCLSRPGGCIG